MNRQLKIAFGQTNEMIAKQTETAAKHRSSLVTLTLVNIVMTMIHIWSAL